MTPGTVIFGIVALVASPSAAAASQSWQGNGCAPDIRQFVEGGVYDIYRARIAPYLARGGGQAVEEGDPTSPESPSAFRDWHVVIPKFDRSATRLFEKLVTDGAWLVFKASGPTGDRRYDQKMFYMNGSRCQVDGPKETTTASMPDEVSEFYRTLFDVEQPVVTDEADVAPVADVAGDPASGLAKLVTDYPVPLLEKVAAAADDCASNGATGPRMDDDFVTKIDIDGDGDLDFVADGRKIHCDRSDGTSFQLNIRPGGTAFWIVMDTQGGLVALDEVVIDEGTITSHGTFATVGWRSSTSSLRLQDGVITQMERPMEGGEVVLTISP